MGKKAAAPPPALPPGGGPLDVCLQKMQQAARDGTPFVPVRVKIEPVDASGAPGGSGSSEAAANLKEEIGEGRPSTKRTLADEEGTFLPEGAPQVEKAPRLDQRQERHPPEWTTQESQRQDSDAKEWISEFTKDKQRYNAFHYRLTKQGDEKKQHWNDIKKFGSKADAISFVDEVMSKTHRQSSDYTSTVTRNETLKQWTTFKKALEKYVEDVLLAMVKNKTLESRRDPSIPEALGIQWPRYLQLLRLSQESELDRSDVGRQMQEHTDLDDEQYEAMVLQQGSRPAAGGGQQASRPAGPWPGG